MRAKKDKQAHSPGLDKKQESSGNGIYDTIRQMILNLEIKPGEKINQLAMSKKLNTSRTPVVNALHRLEAEGLVDSVLNSGFTVHRLSLKELLELFELREALDLVIVGNLVKTITDEEIDGLESIFSSCRDNVELVSQEEYRRLDMKFHSTLSGLCSNRMLKKVNTTMQVFGRSYTAGLLRPVSETIVEHMEIISALRDRDPAAAEKASRAHINKTRDILRNTVENMVNMGLDPDKIHVDEISLLK